MSDQAAGLRALAEPPVSREPSPEGVAACVIGSGKGGVGKSVLAALLACALARRGQRTLLVDGAQNQGNQHVLFGVRPVAPLETLLLGERRARDLVVPVAAGLDLLPADSGAELLYGLGAVDRARLHQRASVLWDDYDQVVVDGGPGLESVVRGAAIRADRLVVVTTPDPTSLSDAYALLKIVHLQVPSIQIGVMVNRVAADEEGQKVFDRLQLAATRFLGRDLVDLGSVPESETLRSAVRQPGTVLGIESAGVDAWAERLVPAIAGTGGLEGEPTRGQPA